MYSCGHCDNPACMGESRRRQLAGRQQSRMRYGKHEGHQPSSPSAMPGQAGVLDQGMHSRG
jgi:hypothetical protein